MMFVFMLNFFFVFFFFFSSRRRHTRFDCDWSSDVCSSDLVVVGETRNYSFEAITKAIRLINDGARFIATNPDATGPSADGVLPATGAKIGRASCRERV